MCVGGVESEKRRARAREREREKERGGGNKEMRFSSTRKKVEVENVFSI